MNKKIMIGSILAVLMLVAISFSAAAVSNQSNDVEKKKAVSPLFGIRTKDAIGEKLSSLKAKFLGERIFFIPVINKEVFSDRQNLQLKLKSGRDTCGHGDHCTETCKLGSRANSIILDLLIEKYFY